MQIRLCTILGVTLATSLLLSSCDRLGFVDPAKEAESRDAESSATGSACRYAGRGIEDCFARNSQARRAAVFSGWKEMDGYMRENKIDVVKPEADAVPVQNAGLAAKETIVH